MKELSIEDKAKRYDEAIEKFDVILNLDIVKESGTIFADDVRKILPELKESDDERIRKGLLYVIKHHPTLPTEEVEEYIAWIEKQGKNNMGISEATKKKLEDNLNKALEKETPESWNKFLDEQCEQNPADKVEPKFKVGDIITNGEIIGKVDENENNKYHGWFGYDKDLSVHYADIPDVENWHLWTIQDAKDGDVLVNKDASYIVVFKRFNYSEDDIDRFKSYFHCREGIFSSIENVGWCCNGFHPATKEQRDLLFLKMKEAGYEWDAEKKELKRMIKNLKSAWSEEDEKYYCAADMLIRNSNSSGYNGIKKYDVIKWYQSLKDRVQPKPKWSEEDERKLEESISLIKSNNTGTFYYEKNELISFLKSLKDRVQSQSQSQWKPSDEQMKAIEHICDGNYNVDLDILDSIYRDFKKLRE